MTCIAAVRLSLHQILDDPQQTAVPTIVPVRTRLIAAALITVVSGTFTGLLAMRPGAVPDFLFPLTGAQLFLEGTNPYLAIHGDSAAPPPFNAPFFYPFTSVLAAIPFAGLSTPLACAGFFGLASGLLAFFVTRDGLWRLHLFASAPYVVAATLAQYSPLVTLAGLLPAAGFLAVLKPNIGIAVLLRKPTVTAVAGCLALFMLSVAIFPSWPKHWLETMARNLGTTHVYEVPMLQVGGLILALAALAWRDAAGRLLLAMSLVPQALFFYDQLPLWLIPRTRKASILLTASSQVAMLGWFALRRPGDSVVLSAYPYVLGLIYVPALMLVLSNQARAWSLSPRQATRHSSLEGGPTFVRRPNHQETPDLKS